MLRQRFLHKIAEQLRVHPICAILGPRQVGKTTLAKQYAEMFFAGNFRFIDLENPLDLAFLENPLLSLSDIM